MRRETFQRSEGIFVPGWHGPRPGGGKTGITCALDEEVERCAHALHDFLGCELDVIEIRFNSDRRSGGGFVKDDSCGTLGATAAIRNGEIAFNVLAGVAYLKDESLATTGDFGHEYAYVHVKGPASAKRWLEEHCERIPRERIPEKTLDRWRTRQIDAVAREGASLHLALREAVRQVGTYAPKEIATEDALATYCVETFKMKPRDAREVAAGVFLVRPRRK